MATERQRRSNVEPFRFLMAIALVFAGVAGGFAFAQHGSSGDVADRALAGLPDIPPGLVRVAMVRPCDIIEVSVANEAKLTNKYAVGEEGAVRLPLVGLVSLDGLTPAAAAGRIAAILADGYVDRPDVSVKILHSDYHSVFVIGAVRLPGVVAMPGPLSLNLVLALAGSPSGAASRTIVVARPRDPETLTPTRVSDPNALTIEMDLERDAWTALVEGDTVFVPSLSAIALLTE